MPKIKVTANELKEVEVNTISLVNSPASQIPFRVIKSKAKDKHMINLSIFKNAEAKKSANDKLIGFVTKTALKDVVSKSLKEQGFEFSKSIEADDEVLLADCEAIPDEAVSVGVLKNTNVILDNVSKSFMPWSTDTNLEDGANAVSFYPSVWNVMELVTDRLYEIMGKAETPAEATAAVSELMTDASNYITNLVSELPEAAFKMMKYANIEDAELNGDDPQMGVEGTVDVSGDDGEGSTDSKSGDNTGDGDGEPASGTDSTTGDSGSDDSGSAETKKSATPDATSFNQHLSEILGVVKSLKDDLDGVKEVVTDVVKSNEETQKEIDTLKSSVIPSPDDDDRTTEVTKKRSDDIWAGSALDALEL